MGLLKTVDEQGRTRRWTLKEVVQGRPLGHPSHPMFVHFPVAFYLAVVVFDVMSRIAPTPGLVLAGTYLIVGAALASVLAVTTGLVDWWGMVRGSAKRRIATRHMILQFITFGFFASMMVLRWPERHALEADTIWIVLGILGYLVLVVGQWLGGILVYQKAMRVSTGGSAG
ncbi:MAG TPA: DUF2231 domain-containing protein [Actinomycetota bacterium]|jgi:uncharacterized membrane protein